MPKITFSHSNKTVEAENEDWLYDVAETTEVYICGGRRMIEDCKSRLSEKGFPETAIHHENFY